MISGDYCTLNQLYFHEKYQVVVHTPLDYKQVISHEVVKVFHFLVFAYSLPIM